MLYFSRCVLQHLSAYDSIDELARFIVAVVRFIIDVITKYYSVVLAVTCLL